MKLRRLDLLRYGHLSEVTLDFPDSAALHVVYGANEAGKSTALAAIADALFGFGHRTDFDFMHGGPQLRIGFGLVAGDGTEAEFVRRKGRGDTLRDLAGNVVPEDGLRRFLGGASRELFERSFGLNGARLREGGQELLRSGGDAGESLLAGTGLLHLRAALTRLDEEARSLVGDGRGRRRLSEAVDAWRQAQHALDERSVAPRAWLEAEATHSEAMTTLGQIQEQTRELSTEDSRLQRVRRVAPLFAELEEQRAIFASHEDVPLLPPEAEKRRYDARAVRQEASRDFEREAADAARLKSSYAGLPQDEAVLAEQDAIDALVARRTLVLQAAEDVRKVRAFVVSHQAKVVAALDELGVSLAPDLAREAVPSAALRASVQRLVSLHAALAATARSAEQSLAVARHRRDEAAAALQANAEPPSPALLRRTIDAMRGEGPLDLDLDRAERALGSAQVATAAALAALPLWQGDLAALAACRLPLPAEFDMAAARLDAAAKEVAEGHAVVAALASEIFALEDNVSRLARGETVPTPDAVAEARAFRDRAWRLIRRLHEGGPQPDTAEQAALPTGSLPDVFEALRDDADRLADRRADDAQRVADFLATTARLELLRSRRAETESRRAAAEAAFAAAESAWHALWAPAGFVPDAPPAMTEWRRARTQVLAQADAEAEARRRRDDLAARRYHACAALSAFLADATSQDNLAALLLRAETECEAAEASLAAHRGRAQIFAQEEARLPELQQAATAANTALETWSEEWAGAVVALGLPSEAATETAVSALGAWARVAEVAPVWRTDQQRIADMLASIETFDDQVRAVQGRLLDPATEEPSTVIAARLGRRLADARRIASDAEALAVRIVAHEAAADEAARRLRAAEAELETLRNLAGAANDADLERAIERARQRDAAAAEIARLGRVLLAQGDGRAEDVLRSEIAGIDPDAVVARLAEIRDELTNLGERRETLSAERTRSEATLAEMRQGRDAASKSQEAEDALADARATAERYARLHVARVLLRSGIDRFRREHQGPLLRAASAHFALLTGGRYARLSVDEDAAGRAVLLAIGVDGTECPVEALSEGARDQLYLALRVATVEDHAANAEPLPFIADDLLVHFDDERAAAAIALLVQLGRTTQVILFTHHDHIAMLAARQVGAVVQNLSAPASTATLRLAPIVVG